MTYTNKKFQKEKQGMCDKPCDEMDLEDFKRWALRYLFDALLSGGSREMVGAVHQVMIQTLHNKVFGGSAYAARAVAEHEQMKKKVRRVVLAKGSHWFYKKHGHGRDLVGMLNTKKALIPFKNMPQSQAGTLVLELDRS
jgi:hypothetical protein